MQQKRLIRWMFTPFFEFPNSSTHWKYVGKGCGIRLYICELHFLFSRHSQHIHFVRILHLVHSMIEHFLETFCQIGLVHCLWSLQIPLISMVVMGFPNGSHVVPYYFVGLQILFSCFFARPFQFSSIATSCSHFTHLTCSMSCLALRG